MIPLILSLLAQFTQPAPPKSVLVVIFDDTGAGDTGGMPVLQDFAQGGLSFTRAYSLPVCSPSRLAAMCGVLPRRHGMGDIVNTYATNQTPSPYPPCSTLTIAEALKGRGYRTGLFGKYHLGRCGDLAGALFDVESSAFVQGWDEVRQMNPDSISYGPGTSYYMWDRVNDGNRNVAQVYATDLQADDFIAWWSSTPGAKIGWLAFNAAHAPYDDPPGYSTPADTRTAFLNILEYADGRLADVLAAVDFDATYVLLFGDNGTPDAARPSGTPTGAWKGTTREGGVRVPLILAGPGITPGCTSRLVSLVDVPATICDLLNISWKGGGDGLSMFSPVARTWVFAERFSAEVDDVAVIEADWKLRVFDPDGPGPAGSVEETYSVSGGVETVATPPQDVLVRLRSELASVPPRP